MLWDLFLAWKTLHIIPLVDLELMLRELPGGPVVRIRRIPCEGLGLTPGWGTKIPQATTWPKKTQKQTRFAGEESGAQGPM